MTDIGLRWSKEIKEDRVLAFEHYAESMMLNQYVIVASRAMTLNDLNKMVRDIHVMIGAPKKKTEEADEKPLDVMFRWLNGEMIPNLPATPEMVEEELEEVASGG